jgi:hypothetical protein
MQWQFSCITGKKLQCNVGTKSVLIWLFLFLFLMIKGRHTHLYNNKKIVITSKGWKYTQAKTKLTTHCMNKSNEEMKTSHTHILEKLVTKICSPTICISYRNSSIPIFVLPLIFLHSCGRWNTYHVTLTSHPISVTILTNCSYVL